MSNYYARSLFLVACAAAIQCPSYAQTGDSPAAQKSVEEIRAESGLFPDRGFTASGRISYDRMPISIGIEEFWNEAANSFQVRLTEFNLDQRRIDSDTWTAIDEFLRQEVRNISLPRIPLSCSARGPTLRNDTADPCIEVRFKFNAQFKNPRKFTRPETGEFWPGGACSIFVAPRTREASIWCYGNQHGMIITH